MRKRQNFPASRSNAALLVAITLTLALQGGAARSSFAAALERPENVSTGTLHAWLHRESENLQAYLKKRGTADGPNEDFDLAIEAAPKPEDRAHIRPATEEEKAVTARTHDLVMEYYGEQGAQRFVGAFLESGAAYADGYQWNTQRWSGFLVPKLRREMLDQAAASGVRNLRVGVNFHDLDLKRPETMQPTVDFCVDAWERGISPTLSVLFFPGMKSLETLRADGSVDPTRSYLNHPEFARRSGQIAYAVLKRAWAAADAFNARNEKLPVAERKPVAHVAVNPINEPETLAGFNGQFWHGAHGPWSSPDAMRNYIPSVVNIAEANVQIRLAGDAASGGRRTLYFHNEAMTPEDYPSHRGDGQFAVSKLMLGDADLMDADMHRLLHEPLAEMQARFDAAKAAGHVNVVEWCVLEYARAASFKTEWEKQAARLEMIGKLGHLRASHRRYRERTGKTAKTDTILMLDYYQQSEFIMPQSMPDLVKELAADHGAALMKIIGVDDDAGFLKVLQTRTAEAERATGQKLWPDPRDRASLDLTELLMAEDGAVLERVIGLRNDWGGNPDPLFVGRRQRAGLAEDLVGLQGTDERRSDRFLNSLLENDAALLKQALQVSNDQDLRAMLAQSGPVADHQSIRDILNQDERVILHRIFGLDRSRRVGFLPPHYARQVRANLRKGLYSTVLRYIDALGVRIGGIGESGTPYFPWADLVHRQMFMSMAAAARDSGFELVRYDLGPLVGTVGWMSGPLVKTIKENSRRANDGILKVVRNGGGDGHGDGDRQFRYELSAWPGAKPWFSSFIENLMAGLGQSSNQP